MACCDRLGGTIRQGLYVPFLSDVDYVRCLVERHEYRPPGTSYPPAQVIGRRTRSDEPSSPMYAGLAGSAGRFPARVGACVSLDGSGDDRRRFQP